MYLQVISVPDDEVHLLLNQNSNSKFKHLEISFCCLQGETGKFKHLHPRKYLKILIFHWNISEMEDLVYHSKPH